MRVIIDAGHGGTARAGSSSAFGSRGPSGTLEKEVTLDIARHVVARLGSGAALTRAADTNLTLGARAQLAAQRDADVFVSIHANSGPPEAAGPETFVHPEASPDSRRLADGVQRALERLRGRYGGVAEPRNGPLAVLSPRALGPRTSACLVEVDYLSNPRAETRLRNPQERAAIGAAIASAIQEHVATQGTRGRHGRPYAQAAGMNFIEPTIDYATTSLAESNRIWQDWLERYGTWIKGVPDSALSIFPHSAICQLTLISDRGTYIGTGFYIGDDKILSCGHNFLLNGEVTTRVNVAPGWSPTMSIFDNRDFTVDGTAVVHPRWATGQDPAYDLSVFRVPGFPPPNGASFTLANRSLGANEGIVVCGYGKIDMMGPSRSQPQRMDGALITEATADLLNYPIQTAEGNSGSPVFHGGTVIGVHTSMRDMASNRGVLLNPGKIDWINSK